jgi:GPI-anchor transamidase subunit GAA1
VYSTFHAHLNHLFVTDVIPASAFLHGHPRLLKLPPYLSILCVLIGIIWLLLIPLNQYSRNTYISENALLPGQVHTYFTGSDQHVFRAFKREVDALVDKEIKELVNHDTLEIFRY